MKNPKKTKQENIKQKAEETDDPADTTTEQKGTYPEWDPAAYFGAFGLPPQPGNMGTPVSAEEYHKNFINRLNEFHQQQQEHMAPYQWLQHLGFSPATYAPQSGEKAEEVDGADGEASGKNPDHAAQNPPLHPYYSMFLNPFQPMPPSTAPSSKKKE